MEKLAALCCLWAFGLAEKEEYCKELDRLFMLSPEDDLLLELEDLGGDCKAVLARIFLLVKNSLNVEEFGKELFAVLEKVYDEKKFTLEEFGKRCFRLWNWFPDILRDKEPFFSLCYADDPLSWGDEEQTRKIYQKTFDHYKEH